MRSQTEARALQTPANDPPVDISIERETELREFGKATVKRRGRSGEVRSIRAKLRASAAGHIAEAAAQVRGRENEHIGDSDYETFTRATRRAITELDQEERLAEFEHVAAVVNEPGPYAPNSPNSYYADLAATASARLAAPEVLPDLTRRSSDVDMSREAVEERLRRHTVDVRLAIQKGDEYGRRAKAILNESWREEDPAQHRQRSEKELRAFTTGGGATASAAGGQAASFVSPYFLMAQWAPYRSPIRAFADQCSSFPLPDWGLQVYIPVFSSADKAGLQSEGATVAETVPSTGLEGAKLETASGQLLLSKQFADRMNTGGGSFDELLAQELNWRVDAEIGKYVINQALAGATVVSGASAYTEAGF
jgi:hypothetical protein